MQDGQAPQDQNPNHAAGQVPEAAAANAAPSVPAVDPQEVAKLRSELERAREDAAKYRVAKREESEARQKALEEQGQYKALAEERAKALAEYQQQLSEMQALSEKAQRWAEYEKGELGRIEEAKAALPESVQRAIDAVPTLDGKRAVLDAFNSQGPRAKAAVDASAGPPAKGGVVDWASLSGEALRQASRADPDGYLRWAGLKSARKPTLIDQLARFGGPQTPR